MINFINNKIFNAYLIETHDYANTKKSILDFAVSIGFDKKLIEAETHPDIITIESENKIIPIATLKNKVINTVNYTPQIAERKFYIIYDVKNIVEASENAMLKTLEEPPLFVSIFLVTSNINNLLDTIKSRCQILKDTDNIDYQKYTELEYVDDALKTLSDINFKTAGEKYSFIERYFETEESLDNLITLYRLALRDALIYKTTLSRNNLILSSKYEYVVSIANSFSLEVLGKLVYKLDSLSIANKYNVNKRIAAFNFLLTQ